jgi:O-antigen/teichoic acid export membrane protein
MASNTRRIAKNTLMLYFRQILIMLVSLYTVRVVLNTLGAEDYGIYNVVAGVVTMFGFLTGSMAAASQRYFSFEIGLGDNEQLRKVFSLSLSIYVMIIIVVLILAETVGLWFVSNRLVIPLERKSAGIWVYQFSIVSFLFSILTSPYMAVIVAHEDMNIYAYVSIVEVMLKLGTVFLLQFIPIDKLRLYGILMCMNVIINTVIYRTICVTKYQECKFRFYWDKGLFNEIARYTGWNLFGASAGVFKFQMVNILLNQFFNPIVVAARGIALTVNNAVASFSQNFSTAIRPQIIKCYAAGQKKEMLTLVFQGSKGTYFLMYLFILPLMLETPFVLSLWLKNPPEYTACFTRLVLMDALVDSMSYSIITAAQATGKNKLYQSVVGSILLLNLPVAWITLSFGAPAWSVMIVSLSLAVIALVARLLIIRRLINFSIRQFFRKVILPLCFVSVLAMSLPLISCHVFKYGFLRLIITLVVSLFSTCIFMYIFGLNKAECAFVKNIIKNRTFFKIP